LRRLAARRDARVADGAFVVEGATLISEAVRAGWDVHDVFHGHGCEPLDVAGADSHELARGVLERVSTTHTPQPHLAIVGRRLASPARLGEPGDHVVVYLDAVSDPGNVGTVLRSAEAMGAAFVVLGSGSVDPFNPKVVRSSAGSLFWVPIVEVDDLSVVVAGGYRSIGTTSHPGDGAVPVANIDVTGRLAIVMGNESHGITPESQRHVNEWTYVPHLGRAESLNVAMATTIICYEIARRREALLN
jgi:TrmH family RNA methyltransferase